MSALAGIWYRDGRPHAGEACARMLSAQLLYGRDDTRQLNEGMVALGRNLFRVLPEDRYDRQPLTGGGGRFRMVADVRLDNREELQESLGIAAGAARMMADAQILLQAWERWGEGLFAHLLGDYAFGVWDAAEQRLVLARDHIGSRPLHYHVGKQVVAFASMPKGLHALPEIPYAPDEERVAEFLALLPESGPQSFFEGISRVEAGCYVTLTPDGKTASRHWQPSKDMIVPRSEAEAVEELRSHLDRAVRARLRGAERRVGAHLSAGLDSSAVAATAARLMEPAGGQVAAFTSVPRKDYDGPDPANRFGDEGPLAAATAALYANMEHVVIRPMPEETVLDGLDRDFYLYDRPLLNLCNQRWMTQINASAHRRGLTVMLTGGVGNMTISYAGNALLSELVGARQWLPLVREAWALRRNGRMRLPGIALAAFGPWLPVPLWRMLGRLKGRTRLDLSSYAALRADRAAELDLEGCARERGLDLFYRPRKDGFETRLWALARIDPGNLNKGTLGGWGIDIRDPTADRRLVEFTLSLPTSVFAGGGHPRKLAQAALADRLPHAVLSERRKGLQAIDWHEGVASARDRLAEEVERLAATPAAARALDLPRIQRLVEEMPNVDWTTEAAQEEYRLALLRGLASGHFLRKAARSNR